MIWNKRGLIFAVDKNFSWMQTHTSLPIADHIKNDTFKIYFSTRDKENRSSVGFIKINLNNPSKILAISKKPILTFGEIGAFDDSGVLASSLVISGEKKYLYYIGWNKPLTVPFRWSIGLAISEDGGKTFRKFSKGPILDRNYIDPYLVSSPTVIVDNGIWKMWYISAIKWEKNNGKLIAPYHIKYAESNDGIHWNRTGKIAIDFKNSKEKAIGRASVVKENKMYRMWYSYSINKYRIGYAESIDGINWKRKDKVAGITVSDSGWDSDSVEHTYIFNHENTRYMLYTGNDFGKTGFGYAVEERN